MTVSQIIQKVEFWGFLPVEKKGFSLIFENPRSGFKHELFLLDGDLNEVEELPEHEVERWFNTIERWDNIFFETRNE